MINEDTIANNSWKKSMNMSMLLLCLYIFFLYTAQNTLFPPVIHSIVMYAFVGWTLLNIIAKRGIINLSYYSIWYLCMIILSFVSFFWAEQQEFSALYIMAVIFIVTFCIMHTVDSLEKLEIILRMFVISAVVMGLMLFATNQVFTDTEERLGEAITGNANSFSALLMIAAVFAAWFFVYKMHILDRIFNFASLLLLLFLMGVSGGRKTIIAVVVCYILFMLSKDFKKTGINLIKIIIAMIAIWLAVTKIPILYEAIGERFEQLFLMLLGETSEVQSDVLREQLVQIALNRWSSNPLIGYGVDTFKYYNQTVTGHFYYAHNNYAEILYDLGLVGFGLYYGFIVYMTRRLFKSGSENRMYKILGLGMIIEVLVYDIGGISYYAVIPQILLCIAFCCIVLPNCKD